MHLATLPHGTYVVGVSGGIDSVVLLHTLVNTQSENRYIVAHFDHGVRAEQSQSDAAFVKQLAQHYQLQYESAKGAFGPDTSEAQLRTARYNFLRQCSKKYHANAILLAHHQDDVLETIIINMIRGTGWRGLASLQSHPGLLRPLLAYSKQAIHEYAKKQQLQWREDATNMDVRYLRNYVRHKIVPRLSEQNKEQLLTLGKQQAVLKRQITEATQATVIKNTVVENEGYVLPRYFLIMCPKPVALECLQMVIVRVHGKRLERPQAERALIFVKTARIGKIWQPVPELRLAVNRDKLVVASAET